MRLFFAFCLLASMAPASAAERPPFRTDADGPLVSDVQKRAGAKDAGAVLQWYQLVEGKFPPEGSAHAISGELIFVDHLDRRFHLRVDRNDSQDRGQWDMPLSAAMLPYGSIWFRGSPAALQDIPLGTHLHGQFYLKDPQDQTPPPPTLNNRRSPEGDFRRCFRLEDDFTHHARQQQLWRIDAVDLDAKKLTATLTKDGQPIGQPKLFDLLTSTRVMQGRGFAELKSLAPGQTALLNLTWITLYGPGRVTDLWLDEPSRALATAQQLEAHRNHIRERGLAGWVEAVDDDAQIVTITFFGGVDPALFDELSRTDAGPVGWPLAAEATNPAAPKGTIAVARESLMTYDPVNDRKGGNILDVKKIPVEPGSAGIQIRVQCDLMLEGYRPRRIVRFYPATWKVMALPREEQFFGRE